MSDGVALSVRPEPGSYRCRWEIPVDLGISGKPESEQEESATRSFPGNLELNGDRWPTGMLFEWTPFPESDFESSKVAYTLPKSFPIPMLRGYLEDSNLEVLLVDVTIRVWNLGQSDIVAAAAFTGADLAAEGDVRFVGAEVQITNLDSICGYTPLAKTKFPQPGKDYRSGKWKAVGNGDSSQTWSDDDAELTLEFDISSSVFDPYHFRVGFTPVVRIEVADALTLREWLDRWVTPLQRIISVATGQEENITFLSFQQKIKTEREPGSRIQVYGTGIKQDPFASRQNTVRKAGSAFTIPQDHSSLMDVIKMWREQVDDHNPILETYNPVMLRHDQHPRARYLLLIPCLEGLYGYQTRGRFEEQKEKHLAARERVIERLKVLVENKDIELESVDLRFVKDRISKRPPEDLAEALKVLFNQVNADSRLDEIKATPLVKKVLKDNEFGDNIGFALRQIRNDLAHGNRGYPASELSAVTRILHRIVRAQMLRTLGLSEEAQQRALTSED